MNESTPLLKQKNASGSSSIGPNNDAYDAYSDRQQRRIFRQKPKAYAFAEKAKRKHRKHRHGYVSVPVDMLTDEQQEAWLQKQKESIERAVTRPGLKQRTAFACDTGKRGRIWEFFDATLSVLFLILYIWVCDTFKYILFFKKKKISFLKSHCLITRNPFANRTHNM